MHRNLDNLVARASVVEAENAPLWPVGRGDDRRPAPRRSCWLRTVRRVDYADRLGLVRATTWILVGRHDPQTPLACAEELAAGIPVNTQVVFQRSGHAPFVEEPRRFAETMAAALGPGGGADRGDDTTAGERQPGGL